jgi:acetoin:2,6-dichlorophenolindophenol oxidoreductase subunit alpha
MASNEQLKQFYETMLKIMLWENTLLRMIDDGKVSGFYHAGRGQEAIPTGAIANLRKDDYIMYAHRGCGYQIAKGLSLAAMYGDFLGRVNGTTKGLGAGIVHIVAPDLGILGQSGTIGGTFPIAAGAAFSAQYRGTDQVCVCFFGDGTSNRGTFHESMNVAACWKLPVVWICENNRYAISRTCDVMCGNPNIVSRAEGYGIAGATVDGMDPEAVYEVVGQAVARARKGEGPTLIEAHTYRFRGHYYGDAGLYREKAEVEEWMKRDPITLLGARLMAEGIVDQAELDAIRARLQKEVDEAEAEATASPFPPDERIREGLFA